MLAAAQWLETRLKTAGLEVGALSSHPDTCTSVLDVIFCLFCQGLIPRQSSINAARLPSLVFNDVGLDAFEHMNLIGLLRANSSNRRDLRCIHLAQHAMQSNTDTGHLYCHDDHVYAS